jgi:formamidopyrimidine-DNA glycosylase
MPELPEVETVCRGLAKALTGARIVNVDVRRPNLRIAIPKNLAARLKDRRILTITRRAKYILINLDNSKTLLLHLGMSGRMIISHDVLKPGRHDHIVFHALRPRRAHGGQKNATPARSIYVYFNDPRRFGMCDLVRTNDLPRYKFIQHLGVEPLSSKLTVTLLFDKLKNRTTSIKAALLDQTIIAGLGNIYVSEVLFRARLSPLRLANSCRKKEIAALIPAIRNVLRTAIKAGGSTLRDYVKTDGELGYFQHHFAVYGREGEACPRCSCDRNLTGGIKRISQAGRSSFYCTKKQL